MAVTQYTITLPQSHTISVDEVPQSTQVETAEETYVRWAGEIGVPFIGTDQVPDADTSFAVDIGASFYDGYGLPAMIDITGFGNIAIYDQDVSALGSIVINDTTNYCYMIRSTRSPIFTFAPIINEFVPSYSRIDDARIRTVGGTTIIYWRASDRSTSSFGYYAVKVEAGFIQMVATGGHFLKVYYASFPDPLDSVPGEELLLDSISNGDTKSYTISLERLSLSGTIDENLLVDNFRVIVHEADNGAQVDLKNVNTAVDPAFSIEFAQSKPMSMTVFVDAFIWEANKVLVAGDIIYPTDPSLTPFYFKVSVGGTTGASEPAWITQAGNVVDNTVTFAWSGGLIKPVTNAPLIPQIVV